MWFVCRIIAYLDILMNSIIPIYSYTIAACNCIDSFTTTCRIDVADYGNYEIHSDRKGVHLCMLMHPFYFK